MAAPVLTYMVMAFVHGVLMSVYLRRGIHSAEQPSLLIELDRAY